MTGTGSSTLGVLTLTQEVLNISLITYDATKNLHSTITCNDPTSALLILNAIAAGNNVTTSIICTVLSVSHSWLSRKCRNGINAVCVDCIDPCGTAQCADLKTMNPCGASVGNGYGCDSRNTSVSAYRILTATLQPISVAASFRSIKATVITKTSASISVVLRTVKGRSVDGIVYCASFPSGNVPISVADIILQNHVVNAVSSSANVSITGLLPATTYNIYCLTQSTLGSSMTLSEALRFKISIVTVCCRSVSISVLIQSMYQGDSSVNAIQVTLDAPPSASLTLSLGINASLSGVTSALVPATRYFTKAIKTTTATYSIPATSSATLGAMSLTATLGGVNKAEYQVVFTSRNNYTVLSVDVPPPVPVLVSVQFSNDGTLLFVTFDSDTDRGGISVSSFECATLFHFHGVNSTAASATCVWTSASLVTISLGGSVTVAVGENFYLRSLTLYKIRALCLSSLAKCARYQYIRATKVNVLPPLTASRPVVGISGPSIIGKCDSFTLDLSSSTGGGGKAFSSILFAVSSTGNGTEAQNFLNSRYVISPPKAVPHGTFPEGLNNIMVTICNFLGACGQGSHQLIVTARYL